jgi:hypothetical protein
VNIEAIGNDPDGKLTRQSHGTSRPATKATIFSETEIVR